MSKDKNVNELITTGRNLTKHILKLDPDDSKVWKLVIIAIERLVKDYVIPAMEIASLSEDSIYTFDLDSVGKTELHNLQRSLFESQLTGLTSPSNDELTKALSTIGIDNLNERERTNFYRVWAGEEAINSIVLLTKFLLGINDKIGRSNEYTFQREKIDELLKLNLPDPVRIHLKTIPQSRYFYSRK
jgi:hypothetical protein